MSAAGFCIIENKGKLSAGKPVIEGNGYTAQPGKGKIDLYQVNTVGK